MLDDYKLEPLGSEAELLRRLTVNGSLVAFGTSEQLSKAARAHQAMWQGLPSLPLLGQIRESKSGIEHLNRQFSDLIYIKSRQCFTGTCEVCAEQDQKP